MPTLKPKNLEALCPDLYIDELEEMDTELYNMEQRIKEMLGDYKNNTIPTAFEKNVEDARLTLRIAINHFKHKRYKARFVTGEPDESI